MARKVAASGRAAGNDRLKIFISYSRRDALAADAIVAALTESGFDVTIDTRDLPFGEKWQAELAELIRLSDTVIWLVSEASIRSDWVNWELDIVAKRNKRLVPVMVGLVNPAELPREVGEIHILPPDRVFNLASDLDTLVRVLETDHAWLKQATRWQDRAAVWLANDRASGRLLSRGELADAERWKDRRPTKAPAPAQEVMDLLLASRQAATRRQRWWVGGSLAATAGALALAAFANLQSIEADRQRGVAEDQTQVAEKQTQIAETQRRVADSVRIEAQKTESGLLSEASKEVLKLPGDSGAPLAMLLALEGMPDLTGDDSRQAGRPHVPQAQVQLDWAFRSNRERARVTQEGTVWAVAWSPDGSKLATGSSDNTARIIEAATGKELARVTHKGTVWAVAWSPDGSKLATALYDDTARIVDAATGAELARVTHEDRVWAVAWSPAGSRLATGSGSQQRGSDDILRVVESATGREIARVTHEGPVWAVAWSPDGSKLATGSLDNTARIIEAATGMELARVTHERGVSAVAWSPDGSKLATGSDDNTARIVDAASGKELARVTHKGRVGRIAWSPDGSKLATGAEDNNARIIEAATGKELARVTHEGTVWAVAWSPDGSKLGTGSSDNTARIIEAATGKELAWVTHEGTVLAVAWSPDGSKLATGSLDNTARIIEAATGMELARVTHERGVSAVAWSPDGSKLATGSDDKMARIVDAATGAELARVTHEGSVYAVAWSPPGAVVGPALLTVSRDKTARLWRAFLDPQDLVDAAKDRATRCLTQAERAQYFLPLAPPTWCVERRLWPYHSDEWHNGWLPNQKAWLADGRPEGKAPRLPRSE